MNYGFIENVRDKLERRINKLREIDDPETYHRYLVFLWDFLQKSSIIEGVLDELQKRTTDAENIADKIVNQHIDIPLDNEILHASVSFFVIKKCVSSENLIEMWTVEGYNKSRSFTENIMFFHQFFVDTLYQYIDEQLYDQRMVLTFLRRYKHKCEWFKREKLFSIYENNTQVGERRLTYDLYEYLYDQGIEFSIEPSSASGKPDLIAAQNTDDPLIADAKIFNPDSGKNISYLVKGFHQIYQYTLDYNDPFGYLIIFKTCEEDLKFNLKNKEQSTPFIMYNNKTIFFIVIDIFPYEKPASQRGKLKAYELNEDQLIKIIENENN